MNYDNINSAWEFGKSRSSYHFRTDVIDPRWDTVIGLGRFVGDWDEELKIAEQEAKRVTIHNRRNTWVGESRGQHDKVKLNQAEKNDVDNVGGDDQKTIFRVNHELGPTFKKMVEMIGLQDHESRLHVQFPTESFIGHIDRFDLNYPGIPQENLIRIGIMLKD